MTKSYSNTSMESLEGLDYSNTVAKKACSAPCESPVLDLSCKKLSSSSTILDYEKSIMISPLRDSICLGSQEPNNNDNQHINSYQKIHKHELDIAQQILSHQHQREQTPPFSSSNHERESPFKNRSYIMTPPSESDSPKKTKFQSIFEHTSSSIAETGAHPAFPMFPIGLPLPIPVSSVPPVLPTLLSQTNTQVPQIQIPTSSTMQENSQTSPDESKKVPRPFKAYPKDPLSITLGPNMLFDQELKKAYSDFRNRMLDSVKRTNEGTNVKMRRISKSPILPTSTLDEKDALYWERRRKNNEAAKRSRDARRAKEDEIAIRAAFLEQEYIRLKYENAVLKDENSKIKCMLYGH